jgi:hypothetical protein
MCAGRGCRLAGDGIDDVADEHQGGHLEERVDFGGGRIGITSMSLALMGCQPRMLEPSKPKPSSKLPSSSSLMGTLKNAARCPENP